MTRGHKKTSTAVSNNFSAEQRVEAISLAALCEPHRRVVFFTSFLVYETLATNVKGKLQGVSKLGLQFL